MKKTLFSLVFAMGCLNAALAAESYVVEVNVGSRQVTIIKDGEIIQGERNTDSCIAQVNLSKEESGKIACELASVAGVRVPSVGTCTVSQDGTVSFAGLTYTAPVVRQAFRDAMGYLRKSDGSIPVYIYNSSQDKH